MDLANILSLSEFEDKEIKKYMDYLEISMKEQEIETLKGLCKKLKENASASTFDLFYIGYTIKQISKEFDLLRVGSESIINIELKTLQTNEKIKKQLVKNKYYLSYLNREIYLFTYVLDNDSLYKLNDSNNLEIASFDELICVINKQKEIFIDDLDKLFNPSNYLVSPFNSTDKFLEGKYFLTNQQEEIRSKISNVFQEDNYILSIQGSAGTGKTLLLYHIAKTLISERKNVAIIHTGILNNAQQILNSKDGWNIYSIKNINSITHNGKYFDYIIIDEAQRAHKAQIQEIFSLSKNGTKIIIGFDQKQTLCTAETKSGVCDKILNESIEKFTLTKKIRTNEKIADFISALFYGKSIQSHPKNNVSAIHFFKRYDAREYIASLKDYILITHTPSRFYHDYIDSFKSMSCCKGTAHEVIGQEFDNVITIIDETFFYDSNNILCNNGREGNPYDQVKMLFQAVTRVKQNLKIVVINNVPVFLRIIELLKTCEQHL